MDRVKKFCNKYYDYIILAVVYGLLHVFIHTDYWDDVGMSAMLKSYHYNLFAYLRYTWNSWSSALFLHAVEVIVEALPNYIWKTLDVIMIVILYHYFLQVVKLLSSYMPDSAPRTFNRFWGLFFFLSFPYCLFATAGWMTTTIAYAWTFSALFYVLYLFLSVSIYTPPHAFQPYSYLLYGAAVLYCANCNLVSFSLTIILLFVYLNCKTKSRTFRILFYEGMFGSILNIIMFLVCPGNRIRNTEDARYHDTAELLDLSFGGHLRMGINSTFYHFISVPNIILFTFCLLLAVCVCFKTRKILIRTASCIPLLLDVFWTGYILFTYTLPNRTLTYIYPDALFQTCPVVEQYFILASAVIMVLLMCYLVAYLTDFSVLSWMLVGNMLVLGLFPCVALGFTTTVSASVMRIASFFYFSIILCACVLIYVCPLLKNKFWKYTFYAFALIGSLLNILQIIRHIIVYG